MKIKNTKIQGKVNLSYKDINNKEKNSQIQIMSNSNKQ